MQHKVKSIIEGSFAVLTDANPRYKSAGYAIKLIDTARQMGFHGITEVAGTYGSMPESSILIPRPSFDTGTTWFEQILMLGRLFGQESVLIKDEELVVLAYTNGENSGRCHVSSGVSFDADDDFTIIEDQKVSYAFDFGKTHDMGLSDSFKVLFEAYKNY